MANPVDASAPVAALAPDFPPPPPPPPLPEHPVIGTSETGAGVQGQSNLDAGVHGICQRALGVVNSGGHAGVLGEAWNGPGISGFSIAGDGVFGHGPSGVHGVSSDPTSNEVGVLGEHPGPGSGVKGTSVGGFGVHGLSTAKGAAPASGEGVLGEGYTGVHGKVSSAGSGVWGENYGRGYGVAGSSAHGNGVIGTAGGASPPDGVNNNGVIGITTTETASGVWGNNTGSGYGVAGSSTNGNGVIGLAAGAPTGGGTANGVIGRTTSVSASGVWGENTGSGYGVTGQSASGIGIYGQGKPAGQFDGNVIINGGNLTMQNGGDVILADFAEDFDVIETGVGSGTVMVMGDDEGLRPCDLPYDKRVAGVVSGAGNFRPAIVLGKQPSKENTLPIALVGKVYCKVDADHAPIQVGDLLTTSDIQGHAMKAEDPREAFGAVIGKALGSLKTGRGLIPILIALQ